MSTSVDDSSKSSTATTATTVDVTAVETAAVETATAIDKHPVETAAADTTTPVDISPVETAAAAETATDDECHTSSTTETSTPTKRLSQVSRENLPIHLQVGDYNFTTTKALLCELQYFKAYFSAAFGEPPKLEDGSYFVDVDGEMFGHILNWLRHRSLPLLWDAQNGFDRAAYHRVHVIADFFGVQSLDAWIKAERYVGAVNHTIERGTYKTTHERGRWMSGVRELPLLKQFTKIDAINITTEDVYVCPRGVDAHRGEPGRCGRQCHKAQGENEPTYEQVSVQWVMYTRETFSINHEALIDYAGLSVYPRILVSRKSLIKHEELDW